MTLHIARWKRYGHDRLYFTTDDGTKCGYFDLSTGMVHPEGGHDPDLIEAPAHEWCQANGMAPPGVPLADTAPAATPLRSRDAPPDVEDKALPASALTADPPPQEAEPGWTDLAGNLPGASLRTEAVAEWEAAKDRSKFAAYANRYVFNNHTQERAWRAGAEGEEYVGSKLNKLRDKGWYVLHSVPVGKRGSDIDHIAVGPGGVFTVNSKNHAGKKIWVAKYQMRVGGQPVPYLRNSRYEAERAQRLLQAHLDFEVPVMGCVVVLTGTVVPEITYKQMPDGVRVLDKWDVPRWLRKRPVVLDPAQVQAVFDVARRSTTWA